MRPGAHRLGVIAASAVAAPVVVGIVYSLFAALDVIGPAGGGRPSLERIARVLSERSVWEGTAWSVWVAAASTALSVVLAIVLALAFRGRRVVDRTARAVALLPLPIPHLVAAVLAVLILAQSGFLARLAFAAGWVSSPAEMPAMVHDPAGAGLIVALVWKETPFLALIAFTLLARGISELEESARTLGASPGAVLRRVTVPLLWRGMMPAAVAVFAFVAGSYEAAALLAPSDPLALPLLTMERYTSAALERRADAFVLALLGVALALAAVAAHELVSRRWAAAEP